MLNTVIKAKIVRNITGIPPPALRNINGLVIAQTGLGCSPIPQANQPKGKAGSTPKKKNIAPNITILRFRCTHDFIINPIPVKQNTAPSQTRGSNNTSKNPIDLLPPPDAQMAVVMHSNTKIVVR
jgi:hypothetical protein